MQPTQGKFHMLSTEDSKLPSLFKVKVLSTEDSMLSIQSNSTYMLSTEDGTLSTIICYLLKTICYLFKVSVCYLLKTACLYHYMLSTKDNMLPIQSISMLST